MAVGAVLVVTAAPTISAIDYVEMSLFANDRVDPAAARGAGYAWCLLIQAIAFFGLGSGVRAVAAARKATAPVALGLAGSLLSAAAVLAWSAIALLWHLTARDWR